MGFAELQDFLLRRMRMSHIYQPVMLRKLLLNRGRATTREIACEILSNDESQIEYYENITRSMVGRVLRERGVVTKQGPDYVLNGFDPAYRVAGPGANLTVRPQAGGVRRAPRTAGLAAPQAGLWLHQRHAAPQKPTVQRCASLVAPNRAVTDAADQAQAAHASSKSAAGIGCSRSQSIEIGRSPSADTSSRAGPRNRNGAVSSSIRFSSRAKKSMV
jgi:hypothetical protein